jgi:hypothetical protein
MLSKTCTRILRPYGFEDVHAPVPAQYALNRSIPTRSPKFKLRHYQH